MIVSFKHRGLKDFFESGTTKGIQANQAKWLRLILARLNAATSPRDMNLPGLFLHELVGQRQGNWADEYQETGDSPSALMVLMPMMSI